MDIERIFSAEQIKVHPNLPKTLKDFTKAAIRANPDNIALFGYEYFKSRVEETEKRVTDIIAKEEEANAKAIEEMDS